MMMKSKFLAVVAGVVVALPTMAAEVTYRTDIAPFIKKQCGECHGPTSPSLQEFKLTPEIQKQYEKEKTGPRIDTYEHLVSIVAYPDPGAFMRRLDDGTSPQAKGKPGNMYRHLGETVAERAAALAMFKAWVGEGGWNLNRWEPRGDVPAVTKEQMDKLKLAY
jgi:hypothetical protein